ncbi:MAG: Holliday junction resolvase RuvX [bacterium]|nr:Holliday junction resolvase RuvX [bacterium]
MRLLGIDYGTKKIGIALSDERGEFALPHSVIENCPSKKCAEAAAARIGEICGKEGVGKIILGESVDYKGRPNPVMEKIRVFKALLEKEIGLPVVYQSEVLTTKESLRRAPDRIGPRGKVSRKRADREIKKSDASAAALILRSFIEKQKVLK